MSVPLSLLDIQPPTQLPELVTTLDALGFHRYWSSEHYSSSQTASPTIVVSLVAGLTHNLRVGTAGVLLRTTTAVRVAADFATLELYFPGRIDLGLAGAAPKGVHRDEIGKDVGIADDAAYLDRIQRVRRLVDPESTTIGPIRDTMPEIWVCGTSERSAISAGRLGVRFAFHQSLVPNVSAVAVLDAYRANFVGSRDGDRPYCAVAAYGTCAANEREARDAWDAVSTAESAPPQFLGTPSDCAEQLEKLVTACRADELVIDVFTPDFESRLEGLTALAKVWLA